VGVENVSAADVSREKAASASQLESGGGGQYGGSSSAWWRICLSGKRTSRLN